MLVTGFSFEVAVSGVPFEESGWSRRGRIDSIELDHYRQAQNCVLLYAAHLAGTGQRNYLPERRYLRTSEVRY